jgi:DNA polymerase-3 subunit epsilon
VRDEAEVIAARLTAHPDYRVLRRLQPDFAGGPALVGGRVRRAAIVDVETTGMDPASDQVIELGVVVFEYDADSGMVGPVVARFSGLEDPERLIPPETTAVHGITDEMVAGQRIDDAAVASVLAGVTLVIAHNAGFDRPFVEGRWPVFVELAWACSIADVDWRSQGYASSALEFLAMRAGLFYDAHRAEVDCLVVLSVLAGPLGETGRLAMGRLLETARQPRYRLAALGAPFEAKDALKRRGYRWNAEARVWTVDLVGADRDAEIEWLRAVVYEGKAAEVEVERVDAVRRYSGRVGVSERVRV